MKKENKELMFYDDIAYRYVRISELNKLDQKEVFRSIFSFVDSLGFSEVDYVVGCKSIMSALAEDHGCFAVVEYKGKEIALGFIKDAAPFEGGAARLEYFSVIPEFQRKGLAKYIISEIRNDYDKSTGMTVACEKKLIPLCEACGFMNPKKSGNSKWYALHSSKTCLKSVYYAYQIADVKSYKKIRVELQQLRKEVGL